MESTQPAAVSLNHKVHDNCMLMPFDISHRYKSNRIYLTDSVEFTNLHPMPSICINFNTSPASSFAYLPSPPLIQIFIRTVNGTTLSIFIDPSSTIDVLKQVICSIEGISPSYQILQYGCRGFENDSMLSELCLADGETLTLLLRLFGGNPDINPKIMPVTWWLGFACSYQVGRAGEEGRICHTLTEFEFEGPAPNYWYSDSPLVEWQGVTLIKSEGL